jgi:hypothetical protein
MLVAMRDDSVLSPLQDQTNMMETETWSEEEEMKDEEDKENCAPQRRSSRSRKGVGMHGVRGSVKSQSRSHIERLGMKLECVAKQARVCTVVSLDNWLAGRGENAKIEQAMSKWCKSKVYSKSVHAPPYNSRDADALRSYIKSNRLTNMQITRDAGINNYRSLVRYVNGENLHQESVLRAGAKAIAWMRSNSRPVGGQRKRNWA